MPIQTIGNTSALGLRPNRGGGDTPEIRASDVHDPHAPNPGDAALVRAIDAVNRMLNPMARGLEFSIDQTTGKTVVKLVDKETNEVLRQMPSREMLAIARALDRVKGLLIHEKA